LPRVFLARNDIPFFFGVGTGGLLMRAFYTYIFRNGHWKAVELRICSPWLEPSPSITVSNGSGTLDLCDISPAITF
jgi:hypothetical protein